MASNPQPTPTKKIIFPQQVVEKIFIGSAYDAADVLNLRRMNITHILTVQMGNYPKYPKEFKYKHLEIQNQSYKDTFHHTLDCVGILLVHNWCYVMIQELIKKDMDQENLREHFETCFAFIEEGLAHGGGGVLVHCGAGISRSATIILAYLMKVKKWRYAEARTFLQDIRPIIEPNDGFVTQLIQFEKDLFEAATLP